jgi:hypothetical protein
VTRKRELLALSVAVLVVSAATAGLSGAFSDGCGVPAGGVCAHLEPVDGLILSADGRTLGETVVCGGRLTDRETATRVTVAFTAAAVGPGEGTCALVALTVTLRSPLNQRTVTDSTSGAQVSLTPGDPHRITLLGFDGPSPTA